MNTIDWLSKLIAFDTTSSNSNLELIHTIKDWFLKYEIQPVIILDATNSKANLLATLPAKNGTKLGGIVLSGHTDVVPTIGQNWETLPYQATQHNEKIIGRGACDMKGFIAVTLALLPRLQRLDLNFPIHFAFSYDEEVGCHGAPHLITKLKELAYEPKACIVGEPTNMQPVIAHKGLNLFKCQIIGKDAHSSLTPQGCNAIEYASKLICFLREFAVKFKTGQLDHNFDVPYTTLSTNMISGGNAYNIIPSSSELIFECRNLPCEKANQIINDIQHYINEQLRPQMKQEYAKADIQLIEIASIPSFSADLGASFTKLCHAISGNMNINKVAYATEAGLFQQAGISTIVCGPGSIEQAHQANEFVTLSQLQQCETFLLKILQYYNQKEMIDD